MTQQVSGAYVAYICQPEASFNLSHVAQSTEFLLSDIATLNKQLQWQADNRTKGLKYVQLDMSLLWLVVFTDLFFANNRGYVICLIDASNTVNIFHGPWLSANESQKANSHWSYTQWPSILI